MSESLLRVIVLPSFIVYPYFELDIDQVEIRKVFQSSKRLNELNDFASFC